MRIVPTALLRRQRQATPESTPESPSSFSTKMKMKAKDKKCSRRANETISKKEERLRDAISVVLAFLNKKGAAVDKYRHNYPAVLTECTEILEKDFRDSLELTKLLSAAWTLLWVHYCEELRCDAENDEHKTDLEQARITCQGFRNKLCFHQVDLMTAVSKESKSSQQRRRHVFSTTTTTTTTTRYEPLRHWTWSNRQWQSHYRLIFVANHAELSISSRAATFATFVPVAIRVCVQFVVTMLHTRSRLAVFKINIHIFIIRHAICR